MGIGVIVTLISAGLGGLMLDTQRGLVWGAMIGLAVLIAEVVFVATFAAIFAMLYMDAAAGSAFHEVLAGIVGKVWGDLSVIAVLISAAILALYLGVGAGAFWIGQKVKSRRTQVSHV